MNQYELYEKREIKRHSLVIGIVLLLAFIIEELFSTAMVVIFTLLGYSSTQINTLLLDPWAGYAINSLFVYVACLVPFCLLKFICKQPISEICCFNSPKKQFFFSSVGFAFGFALIANVVTSIFNIFLETFFGFKAVTSSVGSNTTDDPLEFVFILICSAVVPALVEEFAFRGMVLGTLRKFGDVPAILISSIVFALFHGNFVQIPFALIVGITLGIVFVITGSIWTSVLTHFLINAYAVIANKLMDSFAQEIAVLFYAFIIVGIVCLIYLFKNSAFKLFNNREFLMSTSSKFFKMLFSPSIIVFIALMMYVALKFKA